MPLYSLLPIPDAALVALTFVWGIVGWAFMAPQQSRIVSLEPASQNVSLSLNASAIYVGAAIGSAVGGAIIDDLGFAALGWATGLALVAVLGHIAACRYGLCWRKRLRRGRVSSASGTASVSHSWNAGGASGISDNRRRR